MQSRIRSTTPSRQSRGKHDNQVNSFVENRPYFHDLPVEDSDKNKHLYKVLIILISVLVLSVIAFFIVIFLYKTNYLYKNNENAGANPPLNQQSSSHESSSIIESKLLPWIHSGKADHIMTWSNSEVESIIRQQTGIQNRDIMLSDVWEITSLKLSLHDSFDLADISELKNLRELSIDAGSDNSTLKNLSLLSSLTNLEELTLGGPSLQDLSPLANMDRLDKLVLTGDSITDITPLKSLKQLTQLSLYANNLRDISSLSSLNNLSHLVIKSRAMLNLEALSSLTNLEGLEISQCSVNDIKPIGNLTNLISLELMGMELQDISPLSKLKKLENLNLYDNNISYIEPLKELKNLKELYIHWNPISTPDIMLLKAALPNTNIVSDEKESIAVINTDYSGDFSKEKYPYSSYEGKWVSGQYLDSGNYELELTIAFNSPTSFTFYWSKYRIADFKANAVFEPDDSFGYFSVNQSEYFSADGIFRFTNDTVILKFTRSTSPYVPSESEFVFSKNVTRNGILSEFPDGAYYAVFTDYGSNSDPAVFNLYEAITFSDEFVSTFQVGTAIKYGEGMFFTVKEIVPASDPSLVEKYIGEYGYIMRSRYGVWTLFMWESPCTRDLGVIQAVIPDSIKVTDNWYYLSNGSNYPYPENLRELATRRAANGDEFKYRRFEMRIENGNIISLTLLGGPA